MSRSTLEDSPVVSTTARDDYELTVVPHSERKGWLPISLIWIAIGIDLSGTILGVQLSQGMDFGAAVASTLLGSTLLGLLAMACTYVGASSGLTTAMISRRVFGRFGGIIIAVIMTVSSVGWFGVQVGFFASNAQSAIAQLTGTSVPLIALNAIGGALMMLTALWGYRSIERLSSWAVPLLALLLFIGIGMAVAGNGRAPLFTPVAPAFTFGAAVSLVMGIFVLGVVVSPDIARWAKSPSHAMRAGFIGFFVGNSLIIIVAMVFAKLMDDDDLINIFFTLGMGLAAVLVLTLAQWSTNTINLYSASLNLSAIFTRIPRRLLTLVAGIVATALACVGMYDVFIPFIAAMGIALAPYGGVYIAEFFFGDRSRFTFENSLNEPLLRWTALVSWLAGIAVALLTSDPAFGPGFGAFSLTSIPSMDGLITAVIVQSVLTRTLRRTERARA